jgi:hypothetical protein
MVAERAAGFAVAGEPDDRPRRFLKRCSTTQFDRLFVPYGVRLVTIELKSVVS